MYETLYLFGLRKTIGYEPIESFNLRMIDLVRKEYVNWEKLITEIKDDLLNLVTDPEDAGANPIDLHGIKTKIYNLVKYDSEAVHKPSDQGQRVLKQIAGEVNDRLRSISDNYAKVNDEFQKVAELRTDLIPKLKEARLGNNMRNIAKAEDPFYRDALKELDSVMPEEHKFYDDFESTGARDAFNALWPGQGGGFGSGQCFANTVRAAILTWSPTAAKPLEAALFSPRGQKYAIRGVSKVATGTKKALMTPRINIGTTEKVIGDLFGSDNNE